MERHGLSDASQHTSPPDVVAAMCGAHAQVMSAAELSVGMRLQGATRQTVRDALWVDHSLVKTFGPRGTVHLLPLRDLPMWTGALAGLAERDGNLPDDARLSPEQTDEVVDAIACALADAELTVDELGEAVVEATGPWAGEEVVPFWYEVVARWRPGIYKAAERGVLCFGPNRSRTVTYTNPHRWLFDFEPLEGTSARAELLERYLHAYGPATPHHFARWLAVPVGVATEIFDSLGDELEQVDVDGTEAWVLAGDTNPSSTPADGVRLLPYFDAYSVGGQPREMLFPGRAYERALAGGQAGNYPVLLIDGTVRGVWHQRRSGRKIHVTVEPLEPLSVRHQLALDDQVERLGEILEGKPELTIGTVTVSPHA
jgi:hypothetical protein